MEHLNLYAQGPVFRDPQGILFLVLALALGFALGFVLFSALRKQKEEKLHQTAKDILTAAEERAKQTELDAKDSALKIIRDAEVDLQHRRSELSKEDDRLVKRREELDHRFDQMQQREAALNKRQSTMDRRANEIEGLAAQRMEELQRVSQMSIDEARALLLEEVTQTSRGDMMRIIRQYETEAREMGQEKARELIADAIQRVASDRVAEVTTSLVTLPNEEMKGRIVGRNGRNIRSFEQAAGVDVIVDDTPEAVTISCFDSVRREIAKRTLSRLVVDGRIHPAYIEKILNEERQKMDEDILKAGNEAAYEAGVHGLHPEIIKKLGRLKYRTSYGQNQLAHAVETSKIASVLASELGANVEICKAGALLHDLGKAMDHNTEGTHAIIGAEFAKRHGVNAAIVNVIASHHHEVDQGSVEAVIVEASDAISGARPGARREDLEQYIKRLKSLEAVANAHKGVESSFAIQAGREVRIIVRPDEIDDLAAHEMAREIATEIEETMQYPGQIQVTVIRETRAVTFAK
ncbi:MAG TPA: ribonuclease Y [Anaerolineaceae bacterium]|jgi:ribonuclease Y|nr:ribonuclease Y [Anaerolineaceae bacterium]HPS32011.1 ribonuclease Y [Anaerolineaceae bacterium]